MKIHAHILAWNEEKLLPFTLDYYSTFCEKIYVWDNMSDDSSDEIYKRYLNVIVQKWDSGGKIDERNYCKIKSNCYKQFSLDCDYVIVCDCDEFLFDRNIKQKIQNCKDNNIDMPNVINYSMASVNFPIYNGKLLTELVKIGERYDTHKNIIFNPKYEMVFGIGAHSCKYNGKKSLDPRYEFKLLHYRYLSREYMLERHNKMSKRLSHFNLQNRFGEHYFQDHSNYMNNILKKNINVVDEDNIKKRILLVSDFSYKEVCGGGELVDEALRNFLKADFINSYNIKYFEPNVFYILSNVSTMPQYILNSIIKYDYIILEHDYKFCNSRHPWIYPNLIVPKNEIINIELYKNAKAILVQTTDHLNVFKNNNIEGNFINLKSSLWSESDLLLLKNIYEKNKNNKNGKNVIYQSNNWIKNTNGAIKYCINKNLSYDLLSNQNTREEFLNKLSEYSTLIFFPLARETLSRLVVEARCLDLKIITTNNYGAVLEDWFKQYHGIDLINFLKENTEKNINIIKKIIGF